MFWCMFLQIMWADWKMLLFQNNIIIYPNPLTTSSILQLNAPLRDAEVIIYNMLGKEMLRKKLTGNRMEIEKGKFGERSLFCEGEKWREAVGGEDGGGVREIINYRLWIMN